MPVCALTGRLFHCTLRCVKLPFWGAVVILAALPSCGSSDSKSTGGGGAQGVSGASAESGSGSSEAGSNGSLGGRAGATGVGGASPSAGASNRAGAGGSTVTGGGGDGDAPTDIPASTLTSDLNDTQKAELCDWHAGVFGGYGHSVNCGMGMVAFPADQATCVAISFSGFCNKATVGQFEDCVRSQIPSNGCNITDECLRLSCP